jgi:hypothetical protein
MYIVEVCLDKGVPVLSAMLGAKGIFELTYAAREAV